MDSFRAFHTITVKNVVFLVGNAELRCKDRMRTDYIGLTANSNCAESI